MGTYVVTGSASGMGYQAADRLRAAGQSVIGVDLRDAEVIADLSTPQGRVTAAQGVLAAVEGGCLDGAVLAAGLGPLPGADRAALIYQVNFAGVVELLTAWQPVLAAGKAKVVVVGSNSTTTTPAVPRRAVRALLAGRPDKALRAVRPFGPGASSLAYAASKIAVSRWVRRHAVSADWAGAGIRLNVLAPGAILTPLLEEQLAAPGQSKAVRAFPVPIGGFGDAGQIADWILFMLSDAADFLCGSVIFIDGGSDAYFRPDAWPKGPSILSLPRYFWRFARFARRR
ncbi:MAG: SDR family oxidoreductase [Mycobacterium sp.]